MGDSAVQNQSSHTQRINRKHKDEFQNTTIWHRKGRSKNTRASEDDWSQVWHIKAVQVVTQEGRDRLRVQRPETET